MPEPEASHGVIEAANALFWRAPSLDELMADWRAYRQAGGAPAFGPRRTGRASRLRSTIP
jgi:hypothetical protein